MGQNFLIVCFFLGAISAISGEKLCATQDADKKVGIYGIDDTNALKGLTGLAKIGGIKYLTGGTSNKICRRHNPHPLCVNCSYCDWCGWCSSCNFPKSECKYCYGCPEDACKHC